MTTIELSRDPANADLWVLDGIGTLLRTGRVSRAATAEAAGRQWKIVRHGLVRTGFRATDETGAVVGELTDGFMKRGEALRWSDRALTLRRDGRGSDGHVLLDGDRRLATMTPKREGKRPLDVTLDDPATDAGLLLFVGFIVQAYSDDASFQDHSPGV